MKMFEEYTSKAALTMPKNYSEIRSQLETLTSREIDLLHGAIGVVTEAGELLDMVKKHLFYGKPLDLDNAIEELGDILWYVAVAANWTPLQLEEIANRNIEKLQKRYPKGGFTASDAMTRADKKTGVSASTASTASTACMKIPVAYTKCEGGTFYKWPPKNDAAVHTVLFPDRSLRQVAPLAPQLMNKDSYELLMAQPDMQE